MIGIDWQLCLKNAMNNPQLAEELLAELIATLPTEQRAFAKSFAMQDWQTLREQVHKLHGGCCYTGVPDLQQACKALERAVVDNQIEEIKRNYRQVDACIEAILEQYAAGGYKSV